MLKKSLSLLASILLILQATSAQSQFGTVKGFVKNKKSGEPIPFINVVLEGTTNGAATDVSGFFSITRIKPGTYTLKISAIGYQSFSESVTVQAGASVIKQIFIEPKSVDMSAVDIVGDRSTKKEEVLNSTVKVTPEDIKRLPSVGGEPDIAQYLQVLPGVTSTGDQGGQIYIRGGTPVQNKVLLDGLILYNPFHSIGLFSVFDTDIISNFDVYTGGYGAQYGGRISSIMDLTTKDGNQKRFSGRFTLNTFTAKLMLEGPLKKIKEDGKLSASYIISARTCYLPYTSKVLYPYGDMGSAGLPFGFNDFYGKFTISGNNGSKANFFGFAYTDRAKFQNVSDIKWNQFGGGTSFVLVPGVSNVKIDGNFGYTYYKIGLEEGFNKPRSSTVNGFNFGLNFHSYFGPDRLSYGVEAIGFSTSFDFFNSSNRAISQNENTTEFAGFVRYRLNRGRFVVDPSFRVHYYASLSEVSPEPRLGIKVNITDNFRLKASGGMYSQNLISANSDRDVVNFFYGFLSGSDNLPDKFDGKDVKSRLQKAQHGILGFEWDIVKGLNLNVEGYYKNFSQLTNLNRFKLFEDNAANASIPDAQKKDFIIERGYATGLDATVKYERDRLYIWLVYSLMFTNRFDGVQNYVPVFDRRHNANVVASYKLGKKKQFEINVRWNFGSGFPFTQTGGFYEQLGFQQGIGTNYTSANGNLGLILSDFNKGRLPYYHRLDLNAKWIKKINDNLKIDISVGATNVYNRQNVFYVDRVTFKRVNQLPILPSVGFGMSF